VLAQQSRLNVEKVKEPAVTIFFSFVVVLFVAVFFVNAVVVLVDGSSILII
jgi:hypothetical protein